MSDKLEDVRIPFTLPQMLFQVNFPLLAYTGPEPTQHRVFLVNLAKDEPQICIDLNAEKFQLLDFFSDGTDKPACPEDLERRSVYMLVRSMTESGNKRF